MLLKTHKDWEKIKNKNKFEKLKNITLGPAYSIYKAYSEIPKSRGTFINWL